MMRIIIRTPLFLGTMHADDTKARQCIIRIHRGRDFTSHLADEMDKVRQIYVDGVEYQKGTSAIHFTLEKGTGFTRGANLVALAVKMTTGELTARAMIEKKSKQAEAS